MIKKKVKPNQKKAPTKKVAKRVAKKVPQKKGRAISIQVNLPQLALHVVANIQKKHQEEKNQIIESLLFWDWLKNQTKLSLQTFKQDFNDPVYRVYPLQFPVTSVTGSIAQGGRLNIGGSQLRQEFQFKMFGVLYVADSVPCAIDEYTHGTPLNKNDVRYTLQPTRNFELWDLDQVLNNLNYSAIKILVNKQPIGGGWCNCKVPMPSQILAHWLKSIGGDGIIFPSTQTTGARIIAIFAKDDADSKGNFTILNQVNT
jgi:hypothetical protein